MIQLRMAERKAVIWLFGDEAAFEVRNSLQRLKPADLDVRCFAFTAGTFDSVIDAQLLMAIGGGTQPAAIVVIAGAYDALFSAMAGNGPQDAAAHIAKRLQRFQSALHMRGLHNILFISYCSLNEKSAFVNVGLPPVWAEQVCTTDVGFSSVHLDANAMSETLLLGLGFGKEIGHEPS